MKSTTSEPADYDQGHTGVFIGGVLAGIAFSYTNLVGFSVGLASGVFLKTQCSDATSNMLHDACFYCINNARVFYVNKTCGSIPIFSKVGEEKDVKQ
jgi:hypothetical protein